MEHQNRWLNRTRLYVTTFEDRVTPSVINGLDLGDLALPEDQPAIKRPNTSENMQIVNPALADVQQVTGPSKVFVGAGKTPAAQANQVVNAAMRPPVAQRNVEATNRPNTFRVEAQTKAVTPTFVGGMDFGAVPNRVAPSNSSTNLPPTYGADTRVGAWATYLKPGSDDQDGVNEIAANTDPAQPGTSFSCGFIGLRGTLRKYNAAGVEIASTNFNPPIGWRRACTAIGVSPVAPYNVYVAVRKTGPCAGSICENLILKGPNGLGPEAAFVGGDTFPHAGAGGEVEVIEDIAVGPGGMDVYATGRGDDGAGGSLILDFHYDGALTPGGINLGSWSFGAGVDINGYTNAADPIVVGKRYLGGSLDDGTDQFPLWMDVPADGANTWAWGGLYIDPTNYDLNRMGGIEVDPTGSSLYIAGSVDDTTLPTYGADTAWRLTYSNLMVAQVPTVTGDFTNCAFIYSINNGSTGGDYAARNLAIETSTCVLDDCSIVTTGFVDDEANSSNGIPPDIHFGDLSEFDSAGGLQSFKDVGDIANGLTVTTNGSGIAVAGANVVSGGLTAAGDASSVDKYGGAPLVGDTAFGDDAAAPHQGGTGATGNPTDGYVEGDSLPFVPSAARPVVVGVPGLVPL